MLWHQLSSKFSSEDRSGTHLEHLPANNPIPFDTPWCRLQFYTRIARHDRSPCVRPGEDNETDTGSQQQLQGPERMVFLKQADNTCWLDAMIVAMRVQGVDQLGYDASDVSDVSTSSLPECSRADWSLFTTRDIIYRDPLLHHISAKSGGQIGSENLANLGDLWDYCTVGFPKLAFNIIGKKTCDQCDSPMYHQTPQNRNLNCLRHLETAGHNHTVTQLHNVNFVNQVIDRSKTGFVKYK